MTSGENQAMGQDEAQFVAAITSKVAKSKEQRLYIFVVAQLVACLLFSFIIVVFVDGKISSSLVEVLSIVANPIFLEEWLWLFISLVVMYSSGAPD